MSRYSSNFALSFCVGLSPKNRTPASPYPSSLKPPTSIGGEVLSAVCAEETPAEEPVATS